MGYRKCLYCNEPILPDDETKQIKNRYAHVKCFELHVKSLDEGYQIQKKEKVEEKKAQKIKTPKSIEDVKKGLSEQEFQEKKVLYAYLKTILEDQEIKPQHHVLINKYMNEYCYSYLTLYQILFYIFTILEKPVKGNPIGLVPYYADEALKYYEELDALEERNKDKDIRNMYERTSVKISKRKANTAQALQEWKF